MQGFNFDVFDVAIFIYTLSWLFFICQFNSFLLASSLKQAQLCNKLWLCRHLFHKRWAWPRRLALAGPSASKASHYSLVSE